MVICESVTAIIYVLLRGSQTVTFVEMGFDAYGNESQRPRYLPTLPAGPKEPFVSFGLHFPLANLLYSPTTFRKFSHNIILYVPTFA